MAEQKKSPVFDFSLWTLIFSNIITIFLALTQNWNLLILLWTYWFQSVTIGVFNFIRILRLEDYSAKGIKIGGMEIEGHSRGNVIVALFFAAHYGVFHLAYFSFLTLGSVFAYFQPTQGAHSLFPGPFPILTLAIACGIFFINHLFSYFYNSKRDTGKRNLGMLMLYPYARIIPMHLIILVGYFAQGYALLFFLILKTIADIAMHIIEHRI